jgi:hypothetical protein
MCNWRRGNRLWNGNKQQKMKLYRGHARGGRAVVHAIKMNRAVRIALIAAVSRKQHILSARRSHSGQKQKHSKEGHHATRSDVARNCYHPQKAKRVVVAKLSERARRKKCEGNDSKHVHSKTCNLCPGATGEVPHSIVIRDTGHLQPADPAKIAVAPET